MDNLRRDSKDIHTKHSWDWLMKGELKQETEKAQDQPLNINFCPEVHLVTSGFEQV